MKTVNKQALICFKHAVKLTVICTLVQGKQLIKIMALKQVTIIRNKAHLLIN